MAMNPHRISAADFDALAAGRGGTDAVAELRDAQLSKRVLLTAAVVSTARATAPADFAAAEVDRGVAVLEAVRERDPAAWARVLGHPFVDAWATRCLTELATGDPAQSLLGYLNALAAAAATVAAEPFALPVPIGVAGLPLPTLGVLRLPDDTGTALVSGRSGALRVCAGSGSYDVEPGADGPARPGHHWHPATPLTPHGGWYLDEADPYRDSFEYDLAPWLDPAERADTAGTATAAAAILRREQPEQAAAIGIGLRSIVPLARPGAGREISAASRQAFGAVGSSLPGDPARFAEILVHEFAHAKLGALLDLVDLYEPRAGDVYYAPWRDDPRPLGALLQGVYAHLVVADFWRVHRRDVPPADRDEAEAEYAYRREQVLQSVPVVAAAGALTDLGRRFTGTVAGTARSWEQPPPSAVREAEHRLARHRGAWQHRRLDPAGSAAPAGPADPADPADAPRGPRATG
jgi:uncharacterized protein